jgi:hypothetical protein
MYVVCMLSSYHVCCDAVCDVCWFYLFIYLLICRGNYRLITTDVPLAESLWTRMRAQLPAHVEEGGYTWDAVGLNECFRLAKYTDGDVFGSHVDTCFQRNVNEKSMYTVNIYLNNGNGKQHHACMTYPYVMLHAQKHTHLCLILLLRSFDNTVYNNVIYIL